jgi:transposase
VLRLKRLTGCVIKKPLQNGRPRALNALDIAYLEGLIERTPDLYLSELKAILEEMREVEVSQETIRRSLLRRGFTRKRVSRPALERNEDWRAEFRYKSRKSISLNNLSSLMSLHVIATPRSGITPGRQSMVVQEGGITLFVENAILSFLLCRSMASCTLMSKTIHTPLPLSTLLLMVSSTP